MIWLAKQIGLKVRTHYTFVIWEGSPSTSHFSFSSTDFPGWPSGTCLSAILCGLRLWDPGRASPQPHSFLHPRPGNQLRQVSGEMGPLYHGSPQKGVQTLRRINSWHILYYANVLATLHVVYLYIHFAQHVCFKTITILSDCTIWLKTSGWRLGWLLFGVGLGLGFEFSFTTALFPLLGSTKSFLATAQKDANAGHQIHHGQSIISWVRWGMII